MERVNAVTIYDVESRWICASVLSTEKEREKTNKIEGKSIILAPARHLPVVSMAAVAAAATVSSWTWTDQFNFLSTIEWPMLVRRIFLFIDPSIMHSRLNSRVNGATFNFTRLGDQFLMVAKNIASCIIAATLVHMTIQMPLSCIALTRIHTRTHQ